MSDLHEDDVILAGSCPLDAATRRAAALTLAELCDGDRDGLAVALAMLGLGAV